MKTHNNERLMWVFIRPYMITLVGLISLGLTNALYGQGHLPRPIASYPLDNDPLLEEEYGRNGTVQSVAITKVANRFNVANKAVAFPSSLARIALPNLSQYLDPKKGFSVSFWTKIDETFSTPSGNKPFTDTDTHYQIFYANTTGNSPTTMFGMQRIRDRVSIDRYLPNKIAKSPWGLWLWDPVSFRSGTTTPQGWYHVILTYFKNGCRVMMWKPGETTASCSRNYFWPQTIEKATVWGLGSAITSILPIKYLDDVKFYGEPLDDSQANALHQLENVATPTAPSSCTVNLPDIVDSGITAFSIGKSDSQQEFREFTAALNTPHYRLEEKRFGLSRGVVASLSYQVAGTSNDCPTCLKIQAWIDFNQDGTFQATESILSQQLGIDTPTQSIRAGGLVTNGFNWKLIPTSANIGWTRMRVLVGRSNDLSDLPSCGPLQNGQIKDFYVYIHDDSQYALPDRPCSLAAIPTSPPTMWLENMQFSASKSNVDLISYVKNPYDDFTGLVATLYNSLKLLPGETVKVSLTPSTSLTTTVVPFSKIWIDFNRNGNFNDAGEEVFTFQSPQLMPVAGSTLPSMTGSFTLPATFTSGLSRMRIAIKDRSAPSNCDLTNQYTQDWEVLLDNTDNFCIPNIINDRVAISSLGFIQESIIQFFNPSLADNKYRNVSPSTKNFTLKKGVPATAYIDVFGGVNDPNLNNLHVKAWIDYNGDGQFDNTPDSDEILIDERYVLSPTSPTSVRLSMPLNISSNILDDQVIVRFSIRSNDSADDNFSPCGTILSGRVYDFKLNIVTGSSVPAARVASSASAEIEVVKEPIKPTMSVYPNPTSGDFTAKLFIPNDELVYFELVNLEGKVLGYMQKSLSAGHHEISSREFNNINCNCGGEQTGIQFLKVVTPTFKTSRKILIQK